VRATFRSTGLPAVSGQPPGTVRSVGVLDYHLHLWPHGQRDTAPTVDHVARYCETAQSAGVTEIALTEHLFRFVQADHLLRGFWDEEPDPRLRASMAAYWDDHARADLDAYVECVLEAKSQKLPVVLGLEVDYYRGRMDQVEELLSNYPFDVLLGSVHWIGTWRFDDLSDQVSMDEWSVRDIDQAWGDYTSAMEELAASGACDVLAHPDLIKVAGYMATAPQECFDRLAEAARNSGMAAECSSAGLRKPVEEIYPARPLMDRFAAAGVPFTTASDAHRAEHVADHSSELRELLSESGIDSLQAYDRRKPRQISLASPDVASWSK
jgi:histidinol-phosphatase (PHP family)